MYWIWAHYYDWSPLTMSLTLYAEKANRSAFNPPKSCGSSCSFDTGYEPEYVSDETPLRPGVSGCVCSAIGALEFTFAAKYSSD
jgi:hypothetical protein